VDIEVRNRDTSQVGHGSESHSLTIAGLSLVTQRLGEILHGVNDARTDIEHAVLYSTSSRTLSNCTNLEQMLKSFSDFDDCRHRHRLFRDGDVSCRANHHIWSAGILPGSVRTRYDSLGTCIHDASPVCL